MYDDNEPMKAPMPADDERVDMMRAYVEADRELDDLRKRHSALSDEIDRELDDLRKRHSALSDEIDRTYERKRDLRDRIGQALEFLQSEDSINVSAAKRGAF